MKSKRLDAFQTMQEFIPSPNAIGFSIALDGLFDSMGEIIQGVSN